MSNSNFEITDFTVDATSQELTSVKINNKSFGSNVSLEDNKAATIDASTYTAPVEVTPTSGKDGMKKATITLSNIPAAFDASKLTLVSVAYDSGSMTYTATLSYDGGATFTKEYTAV